MNIIEHPSPNHGPRLPGVRVDTIVLHHTATSSTPVGDVVALAALCSPLPGRRVSAHYFIGHDGKTYRLVPEDRTAWHAGTSKLPWEKMNPQHPATASVNARSIGIELGNPGDGKTPFADAQYLALAQLLPELVGRLGWAAVWTQSKAEPPVRIGGVCRGLIGHILGHRGVSPGRKTDPADNFDWERVREALARGVACPDCEHTSHAGKVCTRYMDEGRAELCYCGQTPINGGAA